MPGWTRVAAYIVLQNSGAEVYEDGDSVSVSGTYFGSTSEEENHN